MTTHHFSLQPFPDSNPIPAIEISGNISRRDREILAIQYQLSGDLAAVEIPPVSDLLTRTTGLWEGTCFELFIGFKNSPEYWEFNLSPAGDWNVFHLDNYRQGLREETAFTNLPFAVQQQANSLALNLEFELNKIDGVNRELDIAITTVIKLQTGEISYWALTHCGSVADFHLRDSFRIEL